MKCPLTSFKVAISLDAGGLGGVHAKYLFRLERMHVDFQRGKSGDVYVTPFGIEVGERDIGPLGKTIGSQHHAITSGVDVCRYNNIGHTSSIRVYEEVSRNKG